MSNETAPIGELMIEEVIEGAIRQAVRSSLNASGFDSVKISAFWLGDEQGLDNIKGLEPPFVYIMASPNTMAGFSDPIRKVSVEIAVVTLQDADSFTGIRNKRNIYQCVRRVFDSRTLMFSDPINAIDWTIVGSSVGAGDNDDFERASFTVEFQLAV